MCEPIGSTTRSCITRKSFTCTSDGKSPISSRNKVPPLANSNLPSLSEIAPVKDPFLCPKSSLSIRSLGIAAQFTGINLCLDLLDNWCKFLATNSLPVPLSPRIKTVASDAAIVSIRLLKSSINLLDPKIFEIEFI